MASCATCGAEGLAPFAACPQCGAMPAPDLDLDVRPRAAPKPNPKNAAEEDAPLELAVDPRSLREARATETAAPSSFPMGPPGYMAPSPLARMSPTPERRATPLGYAPAPNDLEADARALADYGDAPKSAVFAPLYAWRVIKRQRELKAALLVRKNEAEHAQAALDDALVALAERVRPVAESPPHKERYVTLFEPLARAEEHLRSRDRVLSAEQGAQKERLSQVDGRIGKAETELAQAQGHERAVATELAAAQGALAREEAKIKRAEAELKAAQQREAKMV